MPHAIHTGDAPAAPDDFSQAMTAGNLVFTAGQVPMTPTGELRDGDSLADQTRLCLENLRAVLREADATTDDVLKGADVEIEAVAVRDA